MKMKKMRIIGDSQDGKMLEHVITTLNFLEQDNRNFNTSHIFLIGISQDGYNCNNFTQELKGIWADYRQLL